MKKAQHISMVDDVLRVRWDDASNSDFLFIWLRDNDPDELHPDTHERTFDLTSVPISIKPVELTVLDDRVEILWPDRDTVAIYNLNWLFTHRPGVAWEDASKVGLSFWHADTLGTIPRYSADRCMASSALMLEAMQTLKRRGLVLIDGLDSDPLAGERFGSRIGFMRETNFGVSFTVINKPDPNNLAYTALALPLHTDLPNQHVVPGYQFLHCIENGATGGDSVLADGFAVCNDLREESPDSYALLRDTRLPWRFHDETCDIRYHRAIIEEHEDSTLAAFAFNAHVAGTPDMVAEHLREFYPAYQELMVRIRSERYAIQQKLRPGEMIVFDNRRILHGRTAFDPDSGSRYLHGYYIEENELNSRMRMLSKSERENDHAS